MKAQVRSLLAGFRTTTTAAVVGLAAFGAANSAQAEEVVMAAAPAPVAPAADDPLGPQYKSFNSAVWLHQRGYINNPNNRKKMNDVYGMGELDLLFSGQVHKNISWQANLATTWGDQFGKGPVNPGVELLDLIGKIESSSKLVNLWFGRMLVPSDRSNFSGFWFAAGPTYPGFATPGGGPFGPRQGFYGRNDGATVWGQIMEGKFKYYAGAFGLNDGTTTPLISTRLNIALLSPEPGYYHSSTYYGSEDHLTLGLSFQSQKDGSSTMTKVDSYKSFSADLLFEKNLGGSGVVDLEGAFYSYSGEAEAVDRQFFVLASWLSPSKIGWGKLQPLVRYQNFHRKAGADASSFLDAQVSYVIDGYACRGSIGYQKGTNIGPTDSNAVILSMQLMK
jgi:hypothetical protein